MKRLSPGSVLTCELLRFVRDHHPSLNDFAARFCKPGDQEFHILRKADLIRLIDDRIHLNPNLLSPCGRYFSLTPADRYDLLTGAFDHFNLGSRRLRQERSST